MLRPFRLTLILAGLAALLIVGFGCTPKKTTGRAVTSPDDAWKVFRRNYCAPPDNPAVLIKASLYYTRTKPNKRTNRTLVSMWGDFDGPMRLDIAAGMGKLLAHIREDKDGLLVFYPTEKKAYGHVNPILGATRLGMPFPFSLSELASVIMGDFSGLVPNTPVEGTRTKDRFTYALKDGLVTSLTLDATGRPVLLEGRTTKTDATARTWRFEINTYEDEAPKGAAPLPGRLTLIMDNGEKGVLRIKVRELKVAPWSAKALALDLPAEIEYHRLDNGYGAAKAASIPVVYEDK